MALINKLNDLGDAVRERTGTADKLTLEQMATAVKEIPYPVVESTNITANGLYTPSEGVDGFSAVMVEVPAEEPVVEQIVITENGTYTPNEGVDGFFQVDVNVESGGTVELTRSEEVKF